MAAKNSPYLAEFDKALEAWTDQRFASRENLRDLAMFHLYLVNLSEDDGWEYCGHSINLGKPMGRLVVRGVLDGVPSVVFTSGRTPMEMVHTFLRKMREGWLEWSVDKYRQ